MAVQDVNHLRSRLEKQQKKTMKKPAMKTGGLGAAMGNPDKPKLATGMTAQRRDMPAAGGLGAAVNGSAAKKKQTNSSNVANVAAEIMSEDSRLLQLAKSRGMQTANSRGLLNSSIAAGAAETAVLDQVVPMASQEAQQRFNKQQARRDSSMRMREAKQGFGFTSALKDQDAGIAKDLAEQGFGFETKLKDQDAGIAKDLKNQDTKSELKLSRKKFDQAKALSNQQFKEEMGMSRQEYRQDMALQERRLGSEKYLAQLDSGTRQKLMGMEQDMRESLAEMEIGKDEKSNMTSMLTSMHDMYQDSMRSILANTGLPADERNKLLKNAGELLTIQTDLVKSVYAVDFKWADGTFDITKDDTKDEDADKGDGTTTPPADDPTKPPNEGGGDYGGGDGGGDYGGGDPGGSGWGDGLW